MVARDGIEPPTPAFSGPRSTTELPGLSRDDKLIESARNPAEPGEVGDIHVPCNQNNRNQYTNGAARGPNPAPSRAAERSRSKLIREPCYDPVAFVAKRSSHATLGWICGRVGGSPFPCIPIPFHLPQSKSEISMSHNTAR